LEAILWPDAEGRAIGTATGHADVTGGPTGGCQYSGGGPFGMRVVGERARGVLRLRLDDDEQPQLNVITICSTGRHVMAQRPLAAYFPAVEVPETIGGQATVEAVASMAGARGTMRLTVEPLAGAQPP
jgi:hypothetical protein